MQAEILSIAPMTVEEVEVVVDYFHTASAEALQLMGVDPARIPEPKTWGVTLAAEVEKPAQLKSLYFVTWRLGEQLAGFSSISHIAFGQDARMHLHVIEAGHRRAGLGRDAVRMTLPHYFGLFDLKRLYCEPNAYNTAPNRTLQSVGFSYVKTYDTVPGYLNYHQPVTQWVFERERLASLS